MTAREQLAGRALDEACARASDVSREAGDWNKASQAKESEKRARIALEGLREAMS